MAEGEKPKSLREFLMQGNVVDLATAVIIGAAFGAVVTSLVNDIIMPPIGLLLGGVDFSNLFINLSGTSYPSVAAAKAARVKVAAVTYGQHSHEKLAELQPDFLLASMTELVPVVLKG